MFGDSTLQKVSEKLHMQSKTHADQTKSPLCNDFHTFFPNAWYVENKLLPFSYKRAITFTSFHPSNLIVSFCKLTNKHRVFPWKMSWIQNCRIAGLWLGVGCSLWDTCTDGPFSHYDLCRRCLYSHSQGVPRELKPWKSWSESSWGVDVGG